MQLALHFFQVLGKIREVLTVRFLFFQVLGKIREVLTVKSRGVQLLSDELGDEGEEGLDLLQQMLNWSADQRIHPEDALGHPWFAEE